MATLFVCPRRGVEKKKKLDIQRPFRGLAMKQILNHLFENKAFTREQSKEILISIAQGKYNNSQMAAFMTAYCMRSITVNELEGFRDAMLEICLPVDMENRELIDLCGTGGDGKDTFNISTLA